MLRVTALVWFASGCLWLTPFRFRNHSGSARGTFQPCSLLAVVSSMLFVTVLVMVYLRLDSNQRVYLRRLDSNMLVSVNNILLMTVYWQLEWFTCDCIPISWCICGEWISICQLVVLVAVNNMLCETVLVWFASGCSWLTFFRFSNHSGSARKYQNKYHVRVCLHIPRVQHQSSCLIEAFIRAKSLALGSPVLIGLNQGYNQSLLGSLAPIGNPRFPR